MEIFLSILINIIKNQETKHAHFIFFFLLYSCLEMSEMLRNCDFLNLFFCLSVRMHNDYRERKYVYM